MDNILELGTDINSNWSFNDEGDLNLIKNDNNLFQAITNRLTILNGELGNFYSEYGSFLKTFTGWRKNNETLQFIRLELDKTLKQDPRLRNYNIDLKYTNDGAVQVFLDIYFTEDTDLSLSFIITGDGNIDNTKEV